MRNKRELVPELIRTACMAGKATLEVYNTRFSVDLKDDRTPLTEADRASHKIISRDLADLSCPPLFDSPIPVLSEEGRDIPYAERKNWSLFWLVDPLDGTKEFVKRNGEFTINIALISDGSPILGVVYIPVQDTLYFGSVSDIGSGFKGAYRFSEASTIRTDDALGKILQRGAKLPEPQPGLLSNHRSGSESGLKPGPGTKPGQGPRPLKVLGSRSHSSDAFDNYVEELKRRHSKVEILYAGSSVKFCLIAEGSADIYPRLGRTMEWDTAAGHAIVRAVGKRCYGVSTNEELRYNKEELSNDSFVCT